MIICACCYLHFTTDCYLCSDEKLLFALIHVRDPWMEGRRRKVSNYIDDDTHVSVHAINLEIHL